MDVLLMAVVLAVRNRNSEDGGWVQFLVLIIVGVFWVLGVLKAKSRKNEQSQQESPRPVRPRTANPMKAMPEQKLSLQQHRAFRAWQQQQTPRAMKRPEPATKKPSAGKKRLLGELNPIEQLDTEELAPGLEMEMPQGLTQPIVNLGQRKKVAGATVVESAILEGLVADYSDVEQLRRAILHYEILGKPLSLRPPGGQLLES